MEYVEIFEQSTENIKYEGTTIYCEGGAVAATKYLPSDLTDTQTLENKIVIAIAGCEVNKIFGAEALGFSLDFEDHFMDFLEQAGRGDVMKASLFIYTLGLSPQARKAFIPEDQTTEVEIPDGAITKKIVEPHFKKAYERLDLILDKPTLETIKRVSLRLCKQGRMTGDEIREELSVTQESDTEAIR